MFETKIETLKDNFHNRFNRSIDKDTLLKKEIEAHEILFDDKRLPLDPLVSSNYRPIRNINTYNDGDIIRIREAYNRYIVNGIDIQKDGELIKDKNNFYHRQIPDEFQIHFFNEAKTRYDYLQWLRRYEPPVKAGYVLSKESIIIKLWEEFAEAYFPTEPLASWKQRWINDQSALPAIKIEDKFGQDNSRHLLVTILNEAYQYMNIDQMGPYVQRRWGLKQYSSNASRYRLKKDHCELKKIRQILKSE